MKGEARIEYIPLSKIERAPVNVKDHDAGAIHESFKRFGYVEPMVRDERTGKLVAGHGRLDALLDARQRGDKPPDGIKIMEGEWAAPIVCGISFKSDKEAAAYAIASNRLVELGGWHDRDLAVLLGTLAGKNGAGIIGTGFDTDDLDRLLKTLAPKPTVEPEPTATQGKPRFALVLDFESEAIMYAAMERLHGEGYDCRVLNEAAEGLTDT
jgi:hypothetical protein